MKRYSGPTAPLCFRVSTSRIDQLQKLARKRSYETQMDVSAVDLCREALQTVFPLVCPPDTCPMDDGDLLMPIGETPRR